MNKAIHYSLRRWGLLTAMVIVAVLSLPAQDVRMRVDAPHSVSVGQQFMVKYLIESKKEVKETVMIKNMNGFEILMGPTLSTSVSRYIEGGKRVDSCAAVSTYYLKAPKEGKYTLPRGEVTINGRRYRTKAFEIEVISAGQRAKEIENADAFVKVIPSRRSVNLRDTLTVTYKLYTTVDISEIADYNFPYINDFYTQDIATGLQGYSKEKVGGKTYKVAVLRRLLLHPKKVGLLTIPEGSVTVRYRVPTGRKVRDMWGDAYDEMISRDKTLDINPVTIRVQNLKEI